MRAAVTGHPWLAEVAPITGPMYQLFIFFMITDPKTTVRAKRAQCLVAFLVAAVEAVLRLLRVRPRAVLRALPRRARPRTSWRSLLARRADARSARHGACLRHDVQAPRRNTWPDATAANQKAILKNQEAILANQKAILANQGKLDRVLANQKKIEANQAGSWPTRRRSSAAASPSSLIARTRTHHGGA